MFSFAFLAFVFTVLPSCHALPTGEDLDVKVPLLDWTPCNITWGLEGMFFPPEYPYQCSNLSVPLDYSDPDNTEELVLNLIRVEALNQPAKGSILFNPGGPGAAGTEFVATRSNLIHEVLDGDFNLIGFDPRGTGKTLPFNCTPGFPPPSPLKARDIDGVTEMDTIEAAFARDLPRSEELADACLQSMNETGSLIGTAFVARDMLQIVDALDEDGLLHYWGISYGTYLGTTFAAMFPDRVGRILLDSNVNPHFFREGTYYERPLDTDAAFANYLTTCVANPEKCHLAGFAPSSTAEELLDFYNSLKPLLEANANSTSASPSAITWYTIKSIVAMMLYDPAYWQLMTNEILASFINETLGIAPDTSPTEDDDGEDQPIPDIPVEYNEGMHASWGISCSDATLRVSSLDELRTIAEEQWSQGSFADVMLPTNSWTCLNWKMSANEIYDGDFTAETKNPIMLVNGIYDPVTPFASAVNVSGHFPGSSLLAHRGAGHSIFGHPSLCTGHAIRAYFADGTLPEEGAECEPDVEVWDLPDGGAALQGVLPPPVGGAGDGPAALPRVGMKRRSMQGEMTERDVKMWMAMREMGRRDGELRRRQLGGMKWSV